MPNDRKWKDKLGVFINTCQDELKKTTLIGKKMLSASKTTTNLRDDYAELGHLVAKDLKSGALKWDNPKVHQLLADIQQLEADLEMIEKEVQDVKETPMPPRESSQKKTSSPS